MKQLTLYIFILCILISCKNEDSHIEPRGEFLLTIGDQQVLDQDDIQYYDFSSHLVYLKDTSLDADQFNYVDTFRVFADGSEIYTGLTVPMWSSVLYPGPVIHSQPAFYPGYVLQIDFAEVYDNEGAANEDPRSDQRIIYALSKNDQYHAGISCTIQHVKYVTNNQVTVELIIRNHDSFGLYILDPDKMGNQLFHYFTTGLYLINRVENRFYTHGTEADIPEPYDTWTKHWMTLLGSNQSKTYSITYNQFDAIQFGEYEARFEWPGLSYQVDEQDLEQEEGRIWLGRIQAKKTISIN